MYSPIKIKVSIKDLPHPCERRLLVASDISMQQLHTIIQLSFGWSNSQEFQFNDSKMQSKFKTSQLDGFETTQDVNPSRDASQVKLSTFILENSNTQYFWYRYDAQDEWWHQISILKLKQKEADRFTGIPVCIYANGKCPPEDVGGPWGYTLFIDEIHNTHLEIDAKKWHGLDENEIYDEKQVNLVEINDRLKRLSVSGN